MLMIVPNKLLLIKPRHFTVNEQAIPSNKFMPTVYNHVDVKKITEQVTVEHRTLYTTLKKHHFDIHMFDNTNPETPDALFCNNWISVHHPHETHFEQPCIVIYPMALPNRQLEVRDDIIDYVKNLYGNNVEFKDLRNITKWSYLESTGSIVFDRVHKKMYASLSPRTYYWKLMELSDILNYKLVMFQTAYKKQPVYHTNVMMSIGKDWAVICLDVVQEGNRLALLNSLKDTNKRIIEITPYQMQNYCANIIELVNDKGETYTVMSTTAFKAFLPEQLELLGNIIEVPFENIEKYGGGGVRCCITEL